VDKCKTAKQKIVRKNRADSKPLDLTLPELVAELFYSIRNDYISPERSILIDKIKMEINKK
jgi:hypothetical protein